MGGKDKLVDADAIERAERMAAHELAFAKDFERRSNAHRAGQAALVRREEHACALVEACSVLARHYTGLLEATKELRAASRAGGRELLEKMDAVISSELDLNTFVYAHLFLCGAEMLVGQAGAVWAADVRKRGLLDDEATKHASGRRAGDPCSLTRNRYTARGRLGGTGGEAEPFRPSVRESR